MVATPATRARDCGERPWQGAAAPAGRGGV